MKPVTRDVIRDLLPCYLAGEASADTQAMVESFLASDPVLSAEAGQLQQTAAPLPAFQTELGSLEWKTLRRTRGLLQRRAWLVALTLLFTLAPLASLSERGGVVWAMYRDSPVASEVFTLLGLACAAGFLDTCRRLGATGFEPRPSRVRRAVWLATGMTIGHMVAVVLSRQIDGGRWGTWLRIAGFGIAVALGERWHQISTSEDLARPLTLFSGESDRDTPRTR